MRNLHAAGPLLQASLMDRRIVHTKGELNFVTATDRKAEETIIQIIHTEFPDHAILAEESLGRGNSPYRWIIDPLDGTTNFAHTFPFACISIGYEEQGSVVTGGIFDPFHQELFFAQKDQGAFLNNKRIYVSQTPSLSESLLTTGFAYDRRQKIDEYLLPFKEFIMRVHGIRRTGAAALDLCYVACGRFDGFWEAKLHPWDVAAGSLIVTEAGGQITDYGGNPYRLDAMRTVASNGKIHREMIEILKSNG